MVDQLKSWEAKQILQKAQKGELMDAKAVLASLEDIGKRIKSLENKVKKIDKAVKSLAN